MKRGADFERTEQPAPMKQTCLYYFHDEEERGQKRTLDISWGPMKRHAAGGPLRYTEEDLQERLKQQEQQICSHYQVEMDRRTMELNDHIRQLQEYINKTHARHLQYSANSTPSVFG